MSNFAQSFVLKNKPFGTYNLSPPGGILGGLYSFETVSTGAGSIQLTKLGPDGVTQVPVGTAVTAVTTNSSYQAIYLPPGGSYSVTITGLTNTSVQLVRVPV